MAWFARARCNALTVLMRSIAREPISGALCYEWMCTLLPDCDVIMWRKSCHSARRTAPLFGRFGDTSFSETNLAALWYVFSPEAYGDDVARLMNVSHICVDRERKRLPVSGTAVRDNPHSNLHFIPDAVKTISD